MANENQPTPEKGTQVHSEYYTVAFGGQDYYFKIEQSLGRDYTGKRILLGCFEPQGNGVTPNGMLPEGIEFGVRYCLKTALITLPMSNYTYPQNRHFWDFFPFSGDNLREVLALSDDAETLADLLRNDAIEIHEQPEGVMGGVQRQSFHCAVLEPVYEPFRVEDFPTPAEKVDCMLQIVAGLKQLMADETLLKKRVVAHRDLKFNNVVVQHMADGSRRLRLIDFPTIKFVPTDADEQGRHTHLGFLSYENTAPEDVMRRFSVSNKTDVFALGTMLAEMFGIWNYDGIRNPLRLLFHCVTDVSTQDTDTCRRFYESMNNRFPFAGKNAQSWLEKALAQHEKEASWSQIEAVCPTVRSLFRSATAIDPRNRITLRAFEEGMKEIRRHLSQDVAEVVEEEPAEERKVVYFLVDTSDLDTHRAAYLLGAETVLSRLQNVQVAVLPYDCVHSAFGQKANPDPLQVTVHSGTAAVLDAITALPQKARGKAYQSGLKGCLYDLAGFLGNESNRAAFGGEIHVFAPELPCEANLCLFEKVEVSMGTTETQYLTACEISGMLGEKTNVFVHTYRGQRNPGETWYIPAEIPMDVPAAPAEPTKPAAAPVATPKPAEEPQSGVIYMPVVRRGAGFFLLGGKKVEP